MNTKLAGVFKLAVYACTLDTHSYTKSQTSFFSMLTYRSQAANILANKVLLYDILHVVRYHVRSCDWLNSLVMTISSVPLVRLS